MAASDIFFEKIMELAASSTNISSIQSGLFFLSVCGNYTLWKKLDSYKSVQKKYKTIFKILLPILTKITNNETLSKTDKEDVKKIRSKIRFNEL